MREAEMKKIKHAMRNYTQLEGTEDAEKWAEEAHLNQKTESGPKILNASKQNGGLTISSGSKQKNTSS